MTEMELGRRERKKEETRQRIFQAALELFKQKGFEATTVDDITERADVAKGTFFNYYPRKESVVFDLCFEHLTDVENHSEGLGKKPMRAVDQIVERMRYAAELYMKDRDLSRSMLLQLFKGSVPAPEGYEINQRAQDMVRRLVERAQAAGEIRKDVDAERATYVLRSVFFFSVLVWACAPKEPYDLSQELTARIRLALEGLAADRGGPS
jgi:AcrR family transcriptional regulator